MDPYIYFSVCTVTHVFTTDTSSKASCEKICFCGIGKTKMQISLRSVICTIAICVLGRMMAILSTFEMSRVRVVFVAE